MGMRDLPDIYAQAQRHRHIYQANPKCPCYKYNLYPTEAILQRHLECNKSDIRQVLGNNYLLGSYSPVQCLIW